MELNHPHLILKTLNVQNYYVLNHRNVKDFIVIKEKINSQTNRRIKLLHSQCTINFLELRGKNYIHNSQYKALRQLYRTPIFSILFLMFVCFLMFLLNVLNYFICLILFFQFRNIHLVFDEILFQHFGARRWALCD